MATFVLVHGGWHGGWCWRRVTPFLRAAGHEVSAPTLTGLGERAHLLSPQIDLDTHVADLVGVLHYEDLRGVVLVGHSYGGMVITSAASQEPERVAHLVYLDAFVPRAGEAVVDLLPPERRAALVDRPRSEGAGWQVPPPPLEAFGVIREADLAWASTRVGAQPLRTFQQPAQFVQAIVSGLPRTYIRCTEPAVATFAPFAERIQSEPGWRYRELATGHDAMITCPRDLVGLLLDVA